MLKNIVLYFMLVVAVSSKSFAIDEVQQNYNNVQKTFNKMLRAYKNKNMKVFFTYVSENKFQQNFLEFSDNIKDDMRINDILNIDTWIDKITTSGKKSFLYITWKKRYQSSKKNGDILKTGKSMFLFEKIKNRYKLIDFNGNKLFGQN